METPETTKKNEKFPEHLIWIIMNVVFIVLFVLLAIFTNSKLNEFENNINESSILPNVYLDFQNKSGVARIQSTFCEILVGSDGSIKKGDGYEVKLRIINPSSIALRNVTCKFRYNNYNEPAIYQDIKTTILPGKSKIVKCFISNLSDYDLKSINVSVEFDQMSSY